jgi:hypothetical protein
LVYVLLNGENMPGIFPLPVVTTKPFQVPILKTSRNQMNKESFDTVNEENHLFVWEYLEYVEAKNRKNVLESVGNSNTHFKVNSNQEEIEYLEELVFKKSFKADKTFDTAHFFFF